MFLMNIDEFNILFLGRVPRCARVGVLRATLTLRCYAALRTAHAPSACLTQIVF
ncbi:MAG: hypothetical protein NZ455_11315 [Bacteroidia bacterium]|nr:hypothetical protein [Bacteroidia bacterium]